MSKVIIFGANGTAGRRIAREAADRGHQVVGIVRDVTAADSIEGVELRQGDALDAASARASIAGADAVVIAVGSSKGSPWRQAAETVGAAAAASEPAPYLLHMGGGASLLDHEGEPILNSAHFPAEFRVPAEGQADALAWYREEAAAIGLRWTYLSPPPVDFAPGARTGAYRTGLDSPVVDDDGHSRLSYEDFAVAVVDELEQQRFPGRRFTAAY